MLDLRPAKSTSAQRNEDCRASIPELEFKGVGPRAIERIRFVLKTNETLRALLRSSQSGNIALEAENAALRGMLEARAQPQSDFMLERECPFEFVGRTA